jgi:hypothetical protein
MATQDELSKLVETLEKRSKQDPRPVGFIYIIFQDSEIKENTLNIHYVGKTKQQLENRIQGHLSSSNSKIGHYLRNNHEAVRNSRVLSLLMFNIAEMNELEIKLIGRLKPSFNKTHYPFGHFKFELPTMDDLDNISKGYKRHLFVLKDLLSKKSRTDKAIIVNLAKKVSLAIAELETIRTELNLLAYDGDDI